MRETHQKRNLVWIDLEMTGLRPETDVILEIATIITDAQLNVLEQGPVIVIHQPEQKLAAMSDWVREAHTQSGLLEQIRNSSISLEQAEQETFACIKKHCDPNTALLAGNSIWQDRAFLYQYMPDIIDYLFYRMIDVSTIKELAYAWYPDHPQLEVKKAERHRALDDIKESIAELAHYRKHFFR